MTNQFEINIDAAATGGFSVPKSFTDMGKKSKISPLNFEPESSVSSTAMDKRISPEEEQAFNMDILKQFSSQLPDLSTLTPERVAEMDSSSLERMFKQIKSVDTQIKEQLIRKQADLEQLEKESKQIMQQIQEKFGVNSVEELSALMETELKQFSVSFAELQKYTNTIKQEDINTINQQ